LDSRRKLSKIPKNSSQVKGLLKVKEFLEEKGKKKGRKTPSGSSLKLEIMEKKRNGIFGELEDMVDTEDELMGEGSNGSEMESEEEVMGEKNKEKEMGKVNGKEGKK